MPSTTAPNPRLRGRAAECEALDTLVAGARSGQSGALVLRGQPGIGKSALLEYVASHAAGCRGHLLYGEWLRRDGRRVDAREQLRTAHDLAVAMGLDAVAERARIELLATGEHVRKGRDDTADTLTAQEFQIARLARGGLSNTDNGTRIFGLAVLNLTWFSAALRTTLADAGLDGWGAAATAASAAFAGISLALVALSTAVASIAGPGSEAIVSALTEVGLAGFVLSSFPRAMLIMAGTFGFWRAGLISNKQFGLGVLLVVLGVLGGTTWFADGIWARDSLFSLVIWPALGLVWVVAASRVLNRAPSTRTGF